MADFLTPAARSELMGLVRTKGTAPEMGVRRILHRLGYRYKLHSRELPGRPDLVFPGLKKIVLVHGCFWHGHHCARGRLPKTNAVFWERKINRNRERDREVVTELSVLGWRVLEVWECEMKEDQLMGKLVTFLGDYRVIHRRHGHRAR
jgi:DNA mismatch endonuclease (patch repair protein)